MARAAPVVLSHWYHLLESLQASPMEFYQALEQAIERRGIPDASLLRVDWHEAGALSAKREYLRVTRGKLLFDICGAPFGTGFFVSWWLGEARVGPIVVFGLLTGLTAAIAVVINVLGFFLGALVTIVGTPFLLWLFGPNLSDKWPGWDDPIVVIPWIGPLYERWFRSVTYYKVDTALMFQQAVHAAVLEVVDGLTTAKGFRALSESERKPILREFFQR